MTRVKITFSNTKPLFSCSIPVRITDINYGNHLGNDKLLSIIHEARMQLLSSWNFTEMDAGGNSLIMGDVMIAYKAEAFYGDLLVVEIHATELTNKSFDLLYNISASRKDVLITIAHAKTGMICFDYKLRKIAVLKEPLKTRLSNAKN